MTKKKQLLIEWTSKLISLFILVSRAVRYLLHIRPSGNFQDYLVFQIVQMVILAVLIIGLVSLSRYYRERSFLITGLFPLIVLIILSLELPELISWATTSIN